MEETMALTKAIKDLIEEVRKNPEMAEDQIEEKLNKSLAETHVPKNVFNEKINAEKQARDQIADYEKQIKDLEKAGNLSADQQQQIKDLNDKIKKQEQDYQQELTTTKRSYALEQALRGAKARDVKSVLPHIDQNKLACGLNEQLEALQKEKSFLFETEQPGQQKPSFGGSPGGQAPTGDQALAARFAEKLGISQNKD
jgi:small-conductance mechanosensitive channel